MSKILKPGMLCFLVGRVWPENLNKIVKLHALTRHPKKDMMVWACVGMQPLRVGQLGRVVQPGHIGLARIETLRPIDPDGTVTNTEVRELWTAYSETKVPA